MQTGKSGRTLHLAPKPPSTAAPQRPSQVAPGGDTSPAVSGYYARIEGYAQKIRETGDLKNIIAILDEALHETRALHSTDELHAAHRQVETAEQRIEQLKSELELINKLVREDQLTGVLNRRGLDDVFAREAARADRTGASLCIALIDIDNFKNINDSLGHQVGDTVLVHLASVVMDAVRALDVVGRYGGEEFLLLLPDSRIDEAVAVMTRLQRALATRPYSFSSRQVKVTFSAGVAARVCGESEAAVINRADRALYEAKRVGKDRIIVAS